VLALLLAALADGAPESPEEAALTAAIREGDHRAFRRFFERHHAGLLRYLDRRGVSDEVADDLAQAAFVYLWEHRAALDPARSARAYLYRIAHTRALNHFRDTARLVRDVPEDGPSAPTAPASDAAEAAMLQEALAAAVAALPERRRAVFELCFGQGLSHKEAAEALGLSPKTIEHQMGYALKTLRARLERFL
jgi:RNA polymerase sigma-70 factor, ECF subfamily